MFSGKIFFSLAVVCLFVFCEKLIASPPIPPHPICAINATVLDIKKTRKEIEFNKPPSYVDYYAVKLKIHNTTVIRQSELGVSCDKLINTEIDSILYSTDIDISLIKPGREINARIEFKGNVRFSGNYLSDIEILDN